MIFEEVILRSGVRINEGKSMRENAARLRFFFSSTNVQATYDLHICDDTRPWVQMAKYLWNYWRATMTILIGPENESRRRGDWRD